MSELKKESYEGDARQILEHLKKLDSDALVDASHDMDRALQGQGYNELPLWIRRYSREAIQKARYEMATMLAIKG